MLVSLQKIKQRQEQIRQANVKPNVLDIGELVAQLNKLNDKVNEVDVLKNELTDKLIEANYTINQAQIQLERAKEIQKGDKGDNADNQAIAEWVLSQIPKPKDGESVDEEKVVSTILSKIVIPKPKDGVTPTIDEKAIAKKVFGMIKPVEVDHQAIVDKVFEDITTGKKKLSTKHIGDFTEGLEQTIKPIKRLAEGFRGGGDTVDAGTGISIVNIGGKKIISSTGGTGFTIETPTGTVDGANVTFTVTSTPKYIISDGTTYFDGQGYTIVGLTLTLTVPPQFFIRSFF